ncbi:MAG TPA: 50S ribosomal protein P1 [Candidatus Nitrosocosmicus sp.]|jgi:large subunit ribosomal protein L12
MEYVYAALLLHKLKQDINEDNVKNVIKATGVSPDDIQVKSLIAAISEVNIDDALKAAPMAAAPMAAPSPSPTTAGATTEKEDEKKEEKKEEEALEGLSSLFG